MRAFLLFLVTLFSLNSWAQKEYISYHFNQKNGLPQSSVNDLRFDNNLFLWISTEAGLVRYDGNAFRSFTVESDPFIKNDRFRWIITSPQNQLFISNSSGTIYTTENNKVKKTPYYLNTSNRFIGKLPPLPLFNFLQKVFDDSINKWRLTQTFVNSNYKNNYVLGKRYIYIQRSENWIDSIAIPPHLLGIMSFNNATYVYNNKYVFYVNEEKRSLETTTLVLSDSCNNVVYNNNKFPILFDGKRIFIVQQGKSKRELTLAYKTNIEHLVKGDISNIAYNEQEDIFAIGSNTSGLYVLKPKYFSTLAYAYANSKSASTTFYGHVALNDSTLLTTFGSELNLTISKASKYNLKQVNKQTICFDNKGVLWTCRGDTVFYQRKDQERVAIATSIGYPFHNILAFGDSILAIGNQGFALFYNYKCIYVSLLPFKSKLNTTDSYAIIKDNGAFVSSNDFIYRIDFQKGGFTAKQLFYYPNVRHLYAYKDWILGTSYGNGLFVISKGKLIRLPIDRNMYLKKSHSVQITEEENIYISTNNGLFCTSVQQVENFVKDTSIGIYYKYYNENEGIENIEFNGGCLPSSVVLKNGYLSYANIGGLVLFKPADLKVNRALVNRVFFDKVFFDKVEQLASKEMLIPAKTENVSINLSAPFWQNPSNLQMEYKLVGFNKSWNPIININEPLSFTNLSAGNYTLIVKIQTGFTASSIAFFRLSLKKAPKYYETIWFMLGVVIIVVLLIYLVTKAYGRNLVTRNLLLEKNVNERTAELLAINDSLKASEQELIQSIRVKSKLISIISHDIVTPLKFISIVSRNFKSSSDEHTPEKEVIREIHHTSQKLFDNAQNILNWIRYQNNLIVANKTSVSVYAVTEDIAELYLEMANMRKNTIINDVNMDDIVQTDKTILSIILQNLISNAIKYTHSSTIRIESFYENGRFSMSVSDDGPGISEENLNRIESIKSKAKTNMFEDSTEGTGLGYIIIFELAELINSDIIVRSEPKKGTWVTVSL
jgi:signal transduction histidine kinase